MSSTIATDAGVKRRATGKQSGRIKKPTNIGVINPYALTEAKLGRKVNWKRVAQPRKLLEDTLGMPYEQLFDPRQPSPLFAGKLTKSRKGVMVRSTPAIKVGNGVKAINWADPGDFFEEAAEFFDPVQGAVGDCYLIAALASVAWARPYTIAQRTRAASAHQADFVDLIEFFDGAQKVKVEVSEKLPLNGSSNAYIYCRSSESGEIWPAVYEKAYAKWRTHHAGDTPDINLIAGGDPVGACAQLTGLTPYYYSCPALSAHNIWQKVRENSLSRKTFNPMVAWTYCDPPAGVKYSDANLVGCHAYSILGWHYDAGNEYLVLRNPWGSTEATLNIALGTWLAYDTSFWRSVSFASNDGTFGLRADTFKKYFAGFGLVK